MTQSFVEPNDAAHGRHHPPITQEDLGAGPVSERGKRNARRTRDARAMSDLSTAFRRAEDVELTPYTNLIWFDPGGTTGWAVFSIHPEALEDPQVKILENINRWSAGQFSGPENQQIAAALGLCEAWEDAAVGAEDFILRTFKMSRDLLAPVRVTAGIEYGLWVGAAGSTFDRVETRPDEYGGRERVRITKAGRSLWKQQPSLAKSSATDERLKAWGFAAVLKGRPHATDAVRHCLTFLRRAKENAVAVTEEQLPSGEILKVKRPLRNAAWPGRYVQRTKGAASNSK